MATMAVMTSRSCSYGTPPLDAGQCGVTRLSPSLAQSVAHSFATSSSSPLLTARTRGQETVVSSTRGMLTCQHRTRLTHSSAAAGAFDEVQPAWLGAGRDLKLRKQKRARGGIYDGRTSVSRMAQLQTRGIHGGGEALSYSSRVLQTRGSYRGERETTLGARQPSASAVKFGTRVNCRPWSVPPRGRRFDKDHGAPREENLTWITRAATVDSGGEGDGLGEGGPKIEVGDGETVTSFLNDTFPPLPGASPISSATGSAASVSTATYVYQEMELNPKLKAIEDSIEKAIFDFRFFTLLGVVGSLIGSVLCFIKGCYFVGHSFNEYYITCMTGVHTGKVILLLIEAVDVFLVGTVMLIFGMGLYELFITNVPVTIPSNLDRALNCSTLFGMFRLRERPRWMKIRSLDELKTKLGHVIVMILLVNMFEKAKLVVVVNATDLVLFSLSVFLSAGSLFLLNRLHK